MSYATFNGWNIIPMPAAPGFMQVEFDMNDSVGMTQSPFTMQAQTYNWLGADAWEAKLSLPSMARSVAAPWIGWLQALRGRGNVFALGDPMGTMPQGSAAGVPVCNGVTSSMATQLTTKGWTPSIARLLLPGDYLQIGYRLYSVAGATPVSSDSSGHATIEIWPSVREATADGQAITLHNPAGLFRLASNKRGWSASANRRVAIAFDAVEAL